jgi:hypothetical protein
MGITLLKEVVQLLINVIAGGEHCPLVVLRGDSTVHDAEIHRAGADINDHGVVKGVHTVGDRKRL